MAGSGNGFETAWADFKSARTAARELQSDHSKALEERVELDKRIAELDREHKRARKRAEAMHEHLPEKLFDELKHQ